MADRPKGYGFSAEAQEKVQAKYDPEQEAQARDWMQAVVGEPFPAEKFQDALKDGTYLIKLINKLSGKTLKTNQSKMAFKMMENIGTFLSGCEDYGLKKTDLFQTVDLYEAQNIPQVIATIHALGRRAQRVGFNGPVLGPKEATGAKREFSESQLREGQNVIGLQMGSNKGATQSGQTPYGLGRQIAPGHK